MWAWDRINETTDTAETNGQQTVLEDAFTPEELARLTTLRQRMNTQPDYVELGLDLNRLAYVRWLVEQGHAARQRREEARYAPAAFNPTEYP